MAASVAIFVSAEMSDKSCSLQAMIVADNEG